MRTVLPYISINGVISSQENASISVLHQGFQYGFGVFTTLKVREGIPLFLEKHEERLRSSVQQLKIASTMALDIRQAVQDVIKKNEITDGAIRITIAPETNSSVSTVIQATTIETKIPTVAVITVPDERDSLKTLKMTYRVPNLLAQQKAEKEGAQDALFAANSFLIESTYANIYSKNEQGNMITPPIKGLGLNGISRQVLMETLPIEEKEISKDTTDPMVMASSLSIQVVSSIDGREIKYNHDFVMTIIEGINNSERKYIATQRQ